MRAGSERDRRGRRGLTASRSKRRRALLHEVYTARAPKSGDNLSVEKEGGYVWLAALLPLLCHDNAGKQTSPTENDNTKEKSVGEWTTPNGAHQMYAYERSERVV